MDVEEKSERSCRQSCLDGDNTNMVSLYKCMYRKVRDFNNDLEGLFHEDQISAFREGLVGANGKSKDIYQLLIELFGMFKPKNGQRKAHPESATRIEIHPRQPNKVHNHVHNLEHNHEHAHEHNSGNNHEHNYKHTHECNQVYIFSCHPGSVYVMYVCVCVGYECVSSILYGVMHEYISSFEIPSSRFQEFL